MNSNPFGARPSGVLPFALVSGDQVDTGPGDIGSNFDFGFGALAADAEYKFRIFYGVASTELLALAALSSVGAEVYSLGQCASDIGGTGAGDPACKTFIFGFAGVGGTVVPDPTPLPAAAWMFLTGIAGIGGAASLRKRRAARKA